MKLEGRRVRFVNNITTTMSDEQMTKINVTLTCNLRFQQRRAGASRWGPPSTKKDFMLFFLFFLFKFCRVFFFAEYQLSTRQSLCQVSDKKALGKELFAIKIFGTRQRLCRVDLGLCRVPTALGKVRKSVVIVRS